MSDLIPDSDLLIDAWPPRGLGGQHVGVANGVKVIHKPTGISAIVDFRSQHRSKEIAVHMIEAAITHPRFP